MGLEKPADDLGDPAIIGLIRYSLRRRVEHAREYAAGMDQMAKETSHSPVKAKTAKADKRRQVERLEPNATSGYLIR